MDEKRHVEETCTCRACLVSLCDVTSCCEWDTLSRGRVGAGSFNETSTKRQLAKTTDFVVAGASVPYISIC